MRLTLCLSLCLFVAACGGGNDAVETTPPDAKYIPDFSTPEGAGTAFIRAVEMDNIGLLSLTLMDDERDRILPVFEERLRETRRLGLTWSISQEPESELVPNVEARSLLKFTEMKDGEPTGKGSGGWYVFVKTADGSWKYSDAATKRWVAQLLERRNKSATNSPD